VKRVILAAAISLATACASASADISLSAKKKHLTARPQAQIACTVFGCHRIPAGCYPTTGYTWDGIPSGFDVVVCPRRR
jgi:hypothetical protein